MSTAAHPGIVEVLDAIRGRPVARRAGLARRIPETPKAMTPDQVIGLPRIAGPPPGDEQRRRIIEEGRMTTYG